MEDLRPALQQAIEEWDRFERALRDASVHTTRVHCSLQHPPLFSLCQADGRMDIVEVRRGKIKVEKLQLCQPLQRLLRQLKRGFVFFAQATSGRSQKRRGALGICGRILQGSREDCSSRKCPAAGGTSGEGAKTVRRANFRKKKELIS